MLQRARIVCCNSSSSNSFPSGLPGLFKKGLTNPRQLLSAVEQEATVWTLRFVTAKCRGSQLSEPTAGVQVCLVGQSGGAVLHRISSYSDAASEKRELLLASQAASSQLKVECAKSVLQALARPSGPSDSGRSLLRFQEGAVDEISFLGAELGPLASLVIGPESGSWSVEEVTVGSSRTRHTDRFICRHPLGQHRGSSATAFLSPVPEDRVVYGSGISARIVTQMEAKILHAAGMKGYLHLKANLLSLTASLVAGGSACAYILDGWHSAGPFALGGLGGVTYQWLLQQGADAIPVRTLFGSGVVMQALGPGALLRRATSTPTSRVLFGIALLLAAVGLSDNLEAVQMHTLSLGSDGSHNLLLTALGFLMFKLAVVGVALYTPPSSPRELDKKAF